MQPIIQIQGVGKTYASGFTALKSIDLEIRRGEIFALLGPNGAGKTTLISIICGLVNASSGRVLADGVDIVDDYRQARSLIGLVPQELTTDAFETVWNTVSFSRGLFGKPTDPAHIEKVLRQLSLWDKRNTKMLALSGGMKRRVMIAKALSHEPSILFLDEPTAGVDVELRRDMWQMVRGLRESGVTVILTTHYIEEAEEMADRIGVINHGELIRGRRDRRTDAASSGKKQLHAGSCKAPLESDSRCTAPATIWSLNDDGGLELTYTYDTQARKHTGITRAAEPPSATPAIASERPARLKESSLEEIFVNMVHNPENGQ